MLSRHYPLTSPPKGGPGLYFVRRKHAKARVYRLARHGEDGQWRVTKALLLTEAAVLRAAQEGFSGRDTVVRNIARLRFPVTAPTEPLLYVGVKKGTLR